MIRRMLQRMFGRVDTGWDAVHERARAHLANVTKVRDSREFSGDPVIEAEYLRAERLVRETGEHAGKAA